MKYIFPLASYLTITQGFKGVKIHSGIDFGWNGSVPNGDHQFIIAAESGTVVKAVDGYGNTWKKLPKIYGNYVILDHGNKEFTVYGHLEKGSVCVKKGQKVSKGDPIGRMGNSGYSNGQHLHFELRMGANEHNNAVDPLPYLRIENRNLVVSPKTLFPDEIKYRVVTVPVERDPDRDQLRVTGKHINARADHTTKAESYGYIVPGIYNVDDRFQGDTYLWYNCGDFWCADVVGTEFLPKNEIKYRVTAFDIPEDLIEEVETFLDNNQITFCTEVE